MNSNNGRTIVRAAVLVGAQQKAHNQKQQQVNAAVARSGDSAQYCTDEEADHWCESNASQRRTYTTNMSNAGQMTNTYNIQSRCVSVKAFRMGVLKTALSLLSIFLFASPVWSAEWSNTNLGNGWTGVVSTHKEPGVDGGTTDAVDTSTATLLIIGIADYSNVTATCTPTDSKSNTWTALTEAVDVSNVERVKFWYVNSATPTVGSGHTVTCSASTTYPIIFFAAAKTSAASPLDKQNQAGALMAETSALPGSTGGLSEGNQLIVTTVCHNAAGAISIGSSFTITADVQPSGGNNLGGGFAWLTQSGTGALNPTWTIASSTWASNIATFKQGAAAAGTSGGLLLLKVGK